MGFEPSWETSQSRTWRDVRLPRSTHRHGWHASCNTPPALAQGLCNKPRSKSGSRVFFRCTRRHLYPFGWDCHDHRLWRVQLLCPSDHRPCSFLQCGYGSPSAVLFDQILHGLMEETVRLLMGLFGCTIKNLNVVFQQLTRTDLSKKDVPQHCSHTCEGSIPLVDESSQVLYSSAYCHNTQKIFNSVETTCFFGCFEVVLEHEQNISSPYLGTFSGMLLFIVQDPSGKISAGWARERC